MRLQLQSCKRSVDRGKCGLGIEPRKKSNFGASTMSNQSEDKTKYTAIARCILAPRGLRPCARTEASRTGTGISHVWPWQMALRSALRIPREYGSDERTWEVGQAHMYRRSGRTKAGVIPADGGCGGKGPWPRGICSNKTSSGLSTRKG